MVWKWLLLAAGLGASGAMLGSLLALGRTQDLSKARLFLRFRDVKRLLLAGGVLIVVVITSHLAYSIQFFDTPEFPAPPHLVPVYYTLAMVFYLATAMLAVVAWRTLGGPVEPPAP